MTRSATQFFFKSRKVVFGIILLLTAFYQQTEAQVMKGKILDKSGVPVQYATVYIQELKQGTTSNTKGDYEIRLSPGTYMVIFQSLGYEPLIETITISGDVVIRDITLPEQVYEIPEVRISPSGEDPAIAIMRMAIGLAPYYLNYINYYKAEVYLKGNLLMNKIPRLLQKSMRMSSSDENVSVSAGGKPESGSRVIKEGDSFLMESFNEIEFTAPDKYVQRIISFNSTFPEQGNSVSPMEYINASFYQPVIADMAISPLSPQAFSHYNFRYMGASFQGNFTINKIEVKPKRKSQQLFSGTIYIIEDLWCLHSVDLTNENLAGKIRVRELYIPVSEEVWMPVSHQFDFNLQIIGIRAVAGYVSSVKYLDVKTNDKLQKPGDIASGYEDRYDPDTTMTKTKKDINKILQKDELTNRDMVKLARLMDKESKNSQSDSVKKSLEIKDNTTKIVEKDAGKKDSIYWSEIRPIPLSDIDVRSLAVSDSLKSETVGIRTDTIAPGKTEKKTWSESTLKHILMGHTWSDTTGFSFTNEGLINLKNMNFNTVDGLVYGINFRINKRFENHRSLSFYPDLRYAFSRERIMWRINANYATGGMKPWQLYVRTGMISKDFNTGGGINPLINSITSLFLEKNYLKLYETRFLTIGYETEIINGLILELSTGMDNRKVLDNNTSFSLINTEREYTDNIPDNKYLVPGSDAMNSLDDQKYLEFVTNVTFTPYQKYRIYNGNKVPQGSDWPKLSLTWKHGATNVPTLSDDYMHFDMFRFEASQRRETGAFSEFNWKLRTGGFAGKNNLSFFDFFHYNSQPIYLMLDEYEDAFMLPSYYSLSSPEFFGEVHLRYTTQYLLLKLLPGLSKTLIRENLSLSYIGSRFHGNYFELGYGLSEIFLLGKAGIYVGFDDFKYKSFGVRFTLRLN